MRCLPVKAGLASAVRSWPRGRVPTTEGIFVASRINRGTSHTTRTPPEVSSFTVVVTRPTIIFHEITTSASAISAPGSRPQVLGVDPGAVCSTITVRVEAGGGRYEGAGVVVIGLEQPILDFVFDPVGFVGGLDVHKGHCCGLAILILVVAEDLHALDSTKSAKEIRKNE